MRETGLQKQLRAYGERAKLYFEDEKYNIDFFKAVNGVGHVVNPDGCRKKAPTFFKYEEKSLFGLQLLDHDVEGFINYIKRPEKITKNSKNILIYTEVMAYLATGDRNLLSQIPLDDIPKLLPEYEKIEITRDYNGTPIRSIDAATYLILYQFVKNAERYVSDIYSRYHKLIELNRIKLDFVLREKQSKFYVSDTGLGIGPRNLPKIFGDFSTSGGGFGLQCADRLSKMRGGWISVDSRKTRNKCGYTTNNLTREIENKTNRERGTTFMLVTNNLPEEDPPESDLLRLSK